MNRLLTQFFKLVKFKAALSQRNFQMSGKDRNLSKYKK
jgi:hypothetical protein